MKLNKFLISAIAPILCTSAHAAIYSTDFNAGYTATSLDGQLGWSASGVTADGAGSTTGDGFDQAVQSSATAAAIFGAGDTYTSVIDFTFTVTNATSSGAVLQTGFFNGSASSSDRVAMSFNRGGDTGFRLVGPTTNWGNAYTSALGFQQSGIFAASMFGLTLVDGGSGTDFVSDIIRLTTVLTAGADATKWTISSSLRNVTTSMDIGSYSPGGASEFSFAATDVYGGIGWGQGDSNQGTESRNITGFSFDSTVPEPSSSLLLGFATLGLLTRRRR